MLSLPIPVHAGEPSLEKCPQEIAEQIFGFVVPHYLDRANTRCANEDHEEDCFGVGPYCTSCLSLLFVSWIVRSRVLPLYHKAPIIAFIDEPDGLDLYWLSNFIYMLAAKGLLVSKWRFRVNAGASLQLPESKLISMILDQERGSRLTHPFFRRTPRLIKEVLGAAISTAASQAGRSSSTKITFEKGRLEGLFHAPRSPSGATSIAWCPLLSLPFTIKATGLRALRKHTQDTTLQSPRAIPQAIPQLELTRMQYDIRDDILGRSIARRFGASYHYPKWTAADSATHPKPDLWLCYSAHHLRVLLGDHRFWHSDDQRERVERWCRDIHFEDGADEWALQERLMSSLMLDSITMPQVEVYIRIGARLLFCRPLQ